MPQNLKIDAATTYRKVAFRDSTTGDLIVTRSTAPAQKSIEHQGETLPLIDVEVSSFSHPAFTGEQRKTRHSSRIERFERRYGVSG